MSKHTRIALCLISALLLSPAALAANLEVKDGAGNTKYMKSTGAGTNGDPYVPEHTVSGTINAAQSGTWNVNNVSGTISLPTGAATSAKQPTLGTAGSPSSDVISIQGVTSMTPVKVDGSAVTQPVSGTVTVTQSTASNLKVDLSGTAANATAIKVDGSAVTQPISDGGGSITVDNSGTFAVQAAQSGTWTVQPGNTANTTPWLVSAQTATSGGATPYKLNSAASTNATSVKGSAGQLYSIYVTNTNASPRYLKLYNKASSPTVGTDTPVQVYLIPGNTAGAGGTLSIAPGLAFSTGIAFALTTGAADSDTGAVAANEIIVNLGYK